jgi:hypothetical protein
VEAHGPVYVSELLAPLHAELMGCLDALTPEDWERPTVAAAWKVRDVAAHLLDGMLRRLSAGRDGHLPPPDRDIAGYGDLVKFLNDLNASWVAVAKRFSPRVLGDLLAVTGPAAAEHLASLPPHGPAIFAVSWAGEETSEAWMDVGREYTEWWHHQMQIRDAVSAPPVLLEERWFRPLLELSLFVLPHSYRALEAPSGAALVLDVGGAAYSLVRGDGGWAVQRGEASGTAWRLLYNALTPEASASRVAIDGDPSLAAPLLRARSVMV